MKKLFWWLKKGHFDFSWDSKFNGEGEAEKKPKTIPFKKITSVFSQDIFVNEPAKK